MKHYKYKQISDNDIYTHWVSIFLFNFTNVTSSDRGRDLPLPPFISFDFEKAFVVQRYDLVRFV